MQTLDIIKSLWEGFETSLLLFILTLIIALPLGLLMAFGVRSRLLAVHLPLKLLIWIIRGTPLMLQILIVFFLPGLVFGTPIFAQHRFLAALITFGLNYACYFAEIYRGGLDSVAQEQFEAGLVLGLNRRQIYRHIISLQMVKIILPPMSNEIITLVKDTSLVRVIAVVEIIKVAEKFSSKGLIWPLFFTALFYLAFSGLLTLLFNHLEHRLSYFRIV